MLDSATEASIHPKARATGVVYLLYFATAISAVLAAKGIVVPDDAAATAHNILTRESAFRAGVALGLVSNVCYLVLTVLLYRLFRPVNRSLALLLVLFGLVGCTVQVAGTLFQLAPLVWLQGSGAHLQAFRAEQWQELSLLSLRLYAQAVGIALIFFALFCLLAGYLIHVSTFLPRVFGLLLMLAGCGWLTYLWPPLANSLARYVQPFGFLAEFILMLWLLVKGVDTARWREFAARRKPDQALP